MRPFGWARGSLFIPSPLSDLRAPESEDTTQSAIYSINETNAFFIESIRFVIIF